MPPRREGEARPCGPALAIPLDHGARGQAVKEPALEKVFLPPTPCLRQTASSRFQPRSSSRRRAAARQAAARRGPERPGRSRLRPPPPAR
jgi:hypothetical protein